MRLILSFFAVIALLFTIPSYAQRIKDVASIQGVRSNQLVGYGLVVGLPGTGEQSPFTEQSFRTMLTNFGISLDPNVKPKIKNVAAVAVHAELPAFAKPGQTIDITVSSVGEASSLQGGTLLQTFLRGVDGKVYAACNKVIVPTQTEYLALIGLDRMIRTMEIMGRSLDKTFDTIIIPTMFDKRTNAALSSRKRLMSE